MAKQSGSSKNQFGSPTTTSAPADPRGRTDAIRSGLNVISDFFSEDVLLAIQSAAEGHGTWQKALHDPREFFTSKGIDIPDGVFIRFLEAPAIESADTPPAAPIALPQISAARQPPPIQCPPGLVPTAVLVTTPICTKLVEWHVDLGTVDGNPDAHGWFCIDYEMRVEERWVCSSLVTATATKA